MALSVSLDAIRAASGHPLTSPEWWLIDEVEPVLMRIVENILKTLADDLLHVIEVGGVHRSPLFLHAILTRDDPFQRKVDQDSV
jgi:hypothetical protein